MMLPLALVPSLLLGVAFAQESAPIVLYGGHVSICQGKAGDAPDCVTAPHVTYSPDPKYPEKARKARERGIVVLQLVVDADGLTRDITVDRGLTKETEQAAIDAVKQWKFTPASREGHPVPVQVKVEVSFHLY